MMHNKMMTGLMVLLMLAVVPVQAQGVLESGDMVSVNVARHPDMSTTAQVDGNGNVQVPYVGNVQVGGLSEADAAKRVEQALLAVLKNPRVTLSRGGFVVGSPVLPRTDAMETRVIAVENASAEVLFSALQGMSSPGGSINFDPDTNAMIVTDNPTVVQNMLSVVKELDSMDTQLTQVHIEAKIVDVEDGAIQEFGVRWFAQGDHATGGYIPGGRQDSTVNAARSPATTPVYNEILNSGTGANRNNGGIARRFIDEARFDRRMQVPIQVAAPGQFFMGYMNHGIDLGVMLDALAADNKAEMLASPYIRAANHKKAEIRMTEEFPYSEVASAGLNAVSNTKFLEIGIVLEVTPHVRRDPEGIPYIQLELEPEVSSAMGLSNGVPIRGVSKSSSVANVRDGQTLVIGGIVSSDARNVIQKVPGVGNIPVLGNLFKHKERSENKRELMIFVTPTIHRRPETISWSRLVELDQVGSTEDLLMSLEARAEQRKE